MNGHEDGSGLERLFETICDIEAHLITEKISLFEGSQIVENEGN